jgi:hypothetical protein
MKRQLAVLAVAIGTLLAMVGTHALAAPPPNPLVPASGSLAGFSGGELLGEELRQLFELPANQNPFLGVGESCFAAGNNNDVLILWTRPPDQDPARCTVRPGTPVFLFAFFNECSNVEDRPFFGGETEAGQRECAETGLDEAAAGQRPDVPAIKEILVSIDGGRPTDIFSDRYRAGSPQMTANLPAGNIFGEAPQAMTFVAAGWVAMIPPLPPGTHTISVRIVNKKADPFVSGAEVTVVAGRS